MKKEELLLHCKTLGIALNEYTKYRNKDLVYLIGQKNLELGKRENTWALRERINLDTPMVCQWFKNLKKEEKDQLLLDDNNWIAEKKWNGARMIVFYHPDSGFQFFSRHNSDVDFLPVEYNNILLQDKNGELIEPIWFQHKYKMPFIIDSEIITTHQSLDLSVLPRNINKVNLDNFNMQNYLIKSELNTACALIQYNKDDSYILQKQNPLIFKVFDIIMANGRYFYDTPLDIRCKNLKALLEYLPPCFQLSPQTNVNKRNFYEQVVENKGEGVVFKNIYSPYNNKGTRHSDKWVKLKRNLVSNKQDDIDAFVTGFNIGTGKNENLVGSLEFSVYLQDKNGLLKEHVIANIGGFTDEFRNMITDYVDGKPILRQEVYNKVFVIDGHTISAKNLRFNHAVLMSESPRLDKGHMDCILEEEFLLANIL